MIQAIADDGHVLRAEESGGGPTILVVPPGGGDASGWQGVTAPLAAHFRVVLMHRRIYGCWSPPVIGVGHSSGAVALVVAALNRPELFSQIVLYEPPFPTSSPVGGDASRAARAALDAGDPAAAIRIHLRDIVKLPPQFVEYLWEDRSVVRSLAAHAAGQLADTEAIDNLGVGGDRLRGLEVPVVLIDGDQSPLHLRNRVSEMAHLLPNVTAHHTLVGEGHAAHLTAPVELARIIAHAARQQ